MTRTRNRWLSLSWGFGRSGSALGALGLCTMLALLLTSGCKAKMSEVPPDVEAEDMAVSLTCENMKCVDPSAICCNGESCVDVSSNPQHCGVCGKSCSSGTQCQGGSCVCRGGGVSRACASNENCCTTGCKSLDTDKDNCGGCNKACRAMETCSAGACKCGGGAGCSGSQVCCGGTTCADIQNDAMNCGMCGKQCAAGKACKSGVCEGECTGCAMGETCCGGKCANLLNDPMNCKTCGNICPKIIGIQLCIFGICFDPNNADGGAAPDLRSDM